ncbi:uncharacterized protein LOC125845656 [Solanum stenotomum]|uniref:uncharacterized protein LOC125845656 n=1 Tax=Solanum stenotomum TaxID=172797 RepID=UPI0020D1AEEC|nr:uncharacterized protein LOC125845656 [Solanum stenotomum]
MEFHLTVECAMGAHREEGSSDLLEILAEPERIVRYWRRQRRLTYHVPLVASKPETFEEKEDQEPPAVMAEMKVRDVAIPQTSNVTSSIQKPAPGGIFELKKNMGNPKWNGVGAKPVVQKTAGVLEIDAVTALSAQIASIQNMMTTHFSNMSLGKQQAQVNMVMCNEEDITRAMEIPTTRAGETTQTFPGVAIKTNIKDRTNTNHRVVDNSTISKAMEINKLPSKVNVVSIRSGRPLEELPPKEKVAEEKGTHVDEAEPSEQMGIPTYAKYVKDVVANKSRLAKYVTIALTEECSSRIQNRLPINLKVPGSFTIQIKIGRCVVERGLCDLGASINLMPTSMFLKLGLGRPKPTTTMLQLADRSVSRPDGVIQDILVQVGTLIFPVDFVILDFELDQEVQFILGCTFLATRGALIDVAAVDSQ